MAKTSATPRAHQQAARRGSPASQNPLAALKHRTALVHPLTQAAGFVSS